MRGSVRTPVHLATPTGKGRSGSEVGAVAGEVAVVVAEVRARRAVNAPSMLVAVMKRIFSALFGMFSWCGRCSVRLGGVGNS